jgi:hypothetical protein
MAITITRYQLRPPEVDAVLWEKTSDATEIAAWCSGRIIDATHMQIPDLVEGDEGYTATMPCYIFKLDRRFFPIPVAEFEATYTKKLV